MLIIYFNVCFTSIIDENNYFSYKEINEKFKNSTGKPSNYFYKNIRNNDELFNLLELKGKKNNQESDFSKEEPDKIIKRKNKKTNCNKIFIKIIKKKDNFTKVIRKGLYEKYKKNTGFDPKKLSELVEEDLRNLKNSEGYKNFFNDDKLWLIKITNYFDSSVKTIEPTNELREYCKRILEKMQVHFKNLKNKKKIKSVEIALKF